MNEKLDTALTVFEVLVSGIEIEYEKTQWKLGVSEDGHWGLCVVAKTEDGVEVLLDTHCTFSAFVEWANKIPPDQIFLLHGNVILNRTRREVRMS
jgi:hypothetical protein